MRSQWMAAAACLLLCMRTADAATSKMPCAPIDGVQQVLGGSGVFLGDMHGSRETPTFLGDLSCHVMNTGRALVVAMEYDAADQAVLDRFLVIADEKQATSLLTSTRFWTGNKDGRASPGLRDALLSIRRHARAGAQVRLVGYDGLSATAEGRDSASAAHIRRIRSRDTGNVFWIVFGGNVHARKTKGLSGPGVPPGYENREHLGYLIRDWGLVHLDAMYRGGSMWMCSGRDCAVTPMGGDPACRDCPPTAVIRLTRSNPAYDGYYDVGRLTPSPPLHWTGRLLP